MFSKQQLDEFLQESNNIEKEYSLEAFEDAQLAWQYAYKNRDKPFDLKYLLKIHKLLLKRLRPDIAGKLRKCDVYIGGERRDYTTEKELIAKLELVFGILNEFKLKGKSKARKDEWTRIAHVHFEWVHPFEDGNGRSGRILWAIHRIKLGLPLRIIHEGEEQYRYYEWFR